MHHLSETFALKFGSRVKNFSIQLTSHWCKLVYSTDIEILICLTIKELIFNMSGFFKLYIICYALSLGSCIYKLVSNLDLILFYIILSIFTFPTIEDT